MKYPHLSRILSEVGTTLPSRMPLYDLVYDSSEDAYYLYTDYKNGKGDSWFISSNGDSEYLGEIKAPHSLAPSQESLGAHWVDYVPLSVIQEVYGLLDPDFEVEEDYPLTKKTN